MARWSEAVVSEHKILDYLLSMSHPVGIDKAVLFRSLGYTTDDWHRLRDDLLSLAGHAEVVHQEQTRFGIKYVVDGTVRTPVGRTIGLRTIWIGDGPEDPPRLVTAYPR